MDSTPLVVFFPSLTPQAALVNHLEKSIIQLSFLRSYAFRPARLDDREAHRRTFFSLTHLPSPSETDNEAPSLKLKPLITGRHPEFSKTLESDIQHKCQTETNERCGQIDLWPRCSTPRMVFEGTARENGKVFSRRLYWFPRVPNEAKRKKKTKHWPVFWGHRINWGEKRSSVSNQIKFT